MPLRCITIFIFIFSITNQNKDLKFSASGEDIAVNPSKHYFYNIYVYLLLKHEKSIEFYCQKVFWKFFASYWLFVGILKNTLSSFGRCLEKILASTRIQFYETTLKYYVLSKFITYEICTNRQRFTNESLTHTYLPIIAF